MTPLIKSKNPSYSGIKNQLGIIVDRLNVITGAGQVVSDDSKTESTLLFSEQSWVLSIATIANVELQEQIDALDARVTANEIAITANADAVADLEEAAQEAEDIAAGIKYQYNFTHIGDVHKTGAPVAGADFIRNYFSGIVVNITTTGNGFHTVTVTSLYGYVTFSDILIAPTQYPGGTQQGANVTVEAQKLDGTWVAGAGSSWGIAFMGIAIGDNVPMRAKFIANAESGVVTDTAYFDIGNFVWTGVVGSDNIFIYNGSGSTDHDDRDGA